MLLLRVVDFSMWLHPLWEIGLTSKGKIIAILHSAKVSKKLLPLPKKRQFRRSTNDKHCSMAWMQYKCFRYGKQSFFCSRIKCATLLHDNAPFALDRVLILNLPIWAKSLRISHGDDSTAKSSAHIVDINALKTNVWHHYNMHLESRTYETLCKSMIKDLTNLLLCTRTERAGKAMAASWEP